MKKKSILVIFLCIAMVIMSVGCTKEEDAKQESTSKKHKSKKDKVTVEATQSPKEDTEDEIASDEELFKLFLKDGVEVHFSNYQPEKYYEIGEYMFDPDDSVTLSELLAVYDKHYLEELSYTELYKNISYTYIDAGDTGKKQLVVECTFPQGIGAQFVIGEDKGRLEMVYVIDSFERSYGTVANEYGLITTTSNSSYAEYNINNQYLDEKGQIHDVYSEYVDYSFGEPTRLADPILEWAADFKESEGFKDDVILKTYAFDDFDSLTSEEEDALFCGMLYTVEYVKDEVPYHEPQMYEEDSVFSRIFEKAGRKLSTPEEIEEYIAKKENELNMPQKATEGDPVILTDMTDVEVGAILGADVTDGRSELEHALTAYSKFLKNPVNMCEILTSKLMSPYGDPQPGLVYGFALRDFTEDGIPELVIDFGQPAFPLMQQIYIYSYYESDGMVRRMFKMPEGANGDYGLKYIKDEMNESYLTALNEDLERKFDQCPDYADSLLGVKYQGPHMVGTYGKYLVTFDKGTEEDMYETLMWYDFVNDDAQSYTEMLYYMEGDEDHLDYTTDESCIDEPEDILDNFKPILFYDITDENIDRIVSEDYWKANSGDDAFSDYTAEDAYDFLTQKSIWYYDLGIMDDDDTYDTSNCYDYDEETDESITIYFNLDKRIQSRFSRNW